MSIQKKAAELAEEIEKDVRTFERTSRACAEKAASLLRTVASMGGDVEPAAFRFDKLVSDSMGEGWERRYEKDVPTWSKTQNVSPLYDQSALDTAHLAGFEAGRRKGLEDAADLCELDGALYTGFDMAARVRELINKEA